jgi:elongation factor 1 alpha-like protein
MPPTFDITNWRSNHSLSALFKDMPWGNIPQERVTVFIEPQRPRGGLLGGSGAAPKLTKLQQLALARKKKLEQQQSSEEQTEDTRQKLGELSVKEASSLKENRLSEGGGFSKRQKLSETAAAGRMLQTEPAETKADQRPTATQRRNYIRDSKGQAQMAMDGTDERDALESESSSTSSEAPSRSTSIGLNPAPEMAEPSAFAQTLFGSSAVEPEAPATKFFALPYMAYCPSLADAFSKPSPDDVVLAAQAKGSITGKGKN